jgi:hypothetical protein
MDNILDEEYDIPDLDNPEKQLYDAQDTIIQAFLRITVDPRHLHLLKGVPTATQQYQTLKTHLDLGIHAQIFYAANELHILKFTTFEEYATAYTSCINQICDAGITTFREAAPYLFLASINPYYGSAIANVLADTPESLRAQDWTLEAVTRYFGLKRPSRLPIQVEKNSKKAPDRQTRQEKSTTEEEKKDRPFNTHPRCAICRRRHIGVCYGKDWTPNWIPDTDKQPGKAAELPAKELPKGLYTVRSTDNTTSI